MTALYSSAKIAAYQTVAAHGGVAAASPHKLITLLLDGALTRIAEARGCQLRAARAEKSQHLQRALAIVAELRACLAHEHGNIPRSLDRLYEFVERQLLRSHVDSDVRLLDDAARVLQDIRAAWTAIS